MAKKKSTPPSLGRKWLEFLVEPKRFLSILAFAAIIVFCVAAATRPHAFNATFRDVLLSLYIAVEPIFWFLVCCLIIWIGCKIMMKNLDW